jgi:hypothetical protein
MGSFGTALGGVNTPETQQADDDLAAGLIIQAAGPGHAAAATALGVRTARCAKTLRDDSHSGGANKAVCGVDKTVPKPFGSGTEKYVDIRCSVGGFDVGARGTRRTE